MSVDTPAFPEARTITLDDRAWLEDLFGRYPTEVSERTFSSIFIWRAYEGRSRLSWLDDHLVVSWFRQKFGRVVLEPVGPDPASVIEGLAMRSGEAKPFGGVFAVTEPTTGSLKARGMEPLSLRDEWDYVYLTSDLIGLDGPKYHTQRKEMKKATAELELSYQPMSEVYLRECLELEETWCDMKHCSADRFSAAEDNALKEALQNFGPLGLMGGVVLLDGKVQALTAGERLNSNTAVVHFEKANPAIRGLYQVINQRFCETALKDFEYVNREQDVGEPGLRRAKEGYHPDHFVEKSYLPFL